MASKDPADGRPAIRRFPSSEAGAWSNAYVIGDGSEAILFDAYMISREAAELARAIDESGTRLRAVVVSHAHPDHFMGLDAIQDRFPEAKVLSTAKVAADIERDGPWMYSMLREKLGPSGPKRLVIPEVMGEGKLRLGGMELEVVEFGESESRNMAALYVPALRAMLAADLVYNGAHLYLAEKHIGPWLERLEELEAFARGRVDVIHPGHGAAGGLELIAQTREYLHEFAEAVKKGDGREAEARMTEKYPNYRVKQFLTNFSIPAYFPSGAGA